MAEPILIHHAEAFSASSEELVTDEDVQRGHLEPGYALHVYWTMDDLVDEEQAGVIRVSDGVEFRVRKRGGRWTMHDSASLLVYKIRVTNDDNDVELPTPTDWFADYPDGAVVMVVQDDRMRCWIMVMCRRGGEPGYRYYGDKDDVWYHKVDGCGVFTSHCQCFQLFSRSIHGILK